MKKIIFSSIFTAVIISVLCSVPAFAKGSNEIPKAYQAVEFLQKLGALDKDTNYSDEYLDSHITRFEFAEMLAKALGIKENSTGLVYFRDIDESSIVQELGAMGLFYGDGQGNFGKDAIVTKAHISRVLLTATGYNIQADAAGGTDFDYISLAQSRKLVSGKVNCDTYEDVIVALTRALHLNMYLPDFKSADGLSYGVSDDETLLTKHRGLYQVYGRVTANRHTGIMGYEAAGENRVRINSTVYHAYEEDSYLGHTVFAYCDNETDDIEFMVNAEDEDNLITIYAKENPQYDNGRINYIGGSKRKYIDLKAAYDVVYNGVALTKDIDQSFEIDTGYITFIRNSGEREYSIAIINTYKNLTVTGVDLGRRLIFTTDPEFSTIKSTDDGVDIYMTSTGSITDINTMKKDDMNSISVFASKDKELVQIYINDKTVTGTITTLDVHSEEPYISIDGEEFEIAQNYINNAKTLVLGTYGKFFTDYDGKISWHILDVPDTYSYGYIYSVKFTEDDEVIIKLFDESNIKKTLKLAEKVRVDGKTITRRKAYDRFINKQTNEVNKCIISYGLNKDGQVFFVDLPAGKREERESESTLYQYAERYDRSFSPTTYMFDGKYPVFRDSKIFVVPGQGSNEDFSVRNYTPGHILEQKKYTVTMYKYDDSTWFADFVVVEDGGVKTPPEFSEVILVTDLKMMLNGDDEIMYTLTGIERNNIITEYIRPGVSVSGIEKGDIISVSKDANGNIDFIRKDFDLSSKLLSTEFGNLNVGYNRKYDFGPVLSKYKSDNVNDMSIVQMADAANNFELMRAISISNVNNVTIYNSDQIGEEAYIGSVDEIISYENSTTDYDYMFVHWKWLEPKTIVFYK